MEKKLLIKLVLIITAFVLTTSCSSIHLPGTSPSMALGADTTNYNTPLWQGNSADIWAKLQRTSSRKLVTMKNESKDPIKQAWLELALISKQKNVTTQQLANQLIVWRNLHTNHPATSLIPNGNTLSQLGSEAPPKQIAVLLPQSGSYATSGRAVREGFLNAYYVNLAKIGKQNVKFYDTQRTPNMTALYQQAVHEGADFIVGPLVKENVQQMSRGSFSIPVLALNYSNYSLPNNFYEYGLLPEDETTQIAARARQAGLSRALIIAPRNAWGNRLVIAFSTRWQSLGGSIQDNWYYGSQPNFNEGVANLLKVTPTKDKENDKEILAKQRRQDFDVIFLFTPSKDAHAIVPMLKYYYTGNIPIYASSSVYAGKPNPEKDVDLNGVIVCDIPWSIRVAKNGTNEKVQSDRLYAVGQDAYMLSQSLQRLNQLPNFPIYGATGALVLSSQHQIHRRMPCVAIHNGLI